MKKLTLILCAVCIVLAATFTVAASDYKIETAVTDVANDIVTISGKAPLDTVVTVTVFNPGYAGEHIDYAADKNDTAAVQYFGSSLSKKEKFSVDVKMNTKDGGDFAVAVRFDDKEYTGKFTFYPYSKKSGYVSELKNATNATELAKKIPEIMDIYGYASHELYKATGAAEVAEAVVDNNANAALYTPADADTFIKEMMLLAAYRTGSDVIFDGGDMKYADILGIEKTDWYIDYDKSILSSDGKEAVKSGMLAGKYKTLADVRDEFTDLMCYNAVMNNTLSGNGHIKPLFEKYESDYTDAGFDLDLLDGSNVTNSLYNDLLKSDADDIDELAKEFNDIFDEGESGGSHFGGSSSSSSGSSGSSFGSNGSYYIPVGSENAQAAYPFTDMESSSWASAAVEYLYKAGIVNGKTTVTFAPADNITRAEFVKMITEALKIGEGTAEAVFADVAEDAWYAPYIKRAASNSVINGDGERFYPENLVTRQDSAVIIARCLNLTSEEAPAFADAADISDYAVSAVASLSKAEIMNGVGNNTFAPKASLTRAEAAQLIYNVLTKGAVEN